MGELKQKAGALMEEGIRGGKGQEQVKREGRWRNGVEPILQNPTYVTELNQILSIS